MTFPATVSEGRLQPESHLALLALRKFLDRGRKKVKRSPSFRYIILWPRAREGGEKEQKRFIPLLLVQIETIIKGRVVSGSEGQD